jgi:hypothetical protein
MKLYAIALAAATLATYIIVVSPALSADSAALLAQDVQGNISYVTGGVGEDEATTFKRAAAGFPLELQFVQKATPRDEFLADVKVTIRDRSGNVLLDAVSDGPFLLAKLPAGTYRIEADHAGVVKRHTVDIRAGKHERAVFVWATIDEMHSSMLNSAIGSSN